MIRHQNIWHMYEGNKGLIVITDDADRMKEGDIWRLIRGELRLARPIVYRYHMGKVPQDLVATTFPARYLLSDRMVLALSNGNFSGWSTYPVRVIGKDGQEILGYHGFSITGKSGPPDWSRSQRVERQVRGGIWPYLKGVYIDETTWDGSDIFIPEGTGYICIMEAVHEALKPLNLTNIEFQPISEITAPAD